MQDQLFKSDIFFVTTTISVVIITVCFFVVLYQAIRILRDIRGFVSKARTEGEEMIDDLKNSKDSIKNKIIAFISLLASYAVVSKKKKTNNKNKKI